MSASQPRDTSAVIDRIFERAANTPAQRWLTNASAVLKANPELRAEKP